MPRLEHSPDMVIGTRMSDMRPAVRTYAENIQAQRVALIADLGFPSLQALQDAAHADMKRFTKSPYQEKITKLLELSHIIHAILSNPKEYKIPIEQEFQEKETELTELLGPDFFLGFDAIEKTFTLKDGTHVLEISPEERQEAMEQLLTKLAEPDVVDFLKNLESDPTEASKWMLVYRTSAKIINPNTHKELPVSILSLRDVLDTDARQGTNPTKLVYRDLKDWYRYDKKQGDTTPWASRPVQPGWMFVTRTVVDGTTGNEHPDKTPILAKKAKSLGFADNTFRRRTPQEVLYDTLVIYKHTNGRVRLLDTKYDRTEQETSDGSVICVGIFVVDGVRVYGRGPDDAFGRVGACLSR